VRGVLSVWVLLSFLICAPSHAAEQLPPAPAQYFNDYAHVISPRVASTLNSRLEQFEKDSSSQIVVAIFPQLPANSALEDFTVRTAQAWRVGGKAKDNGAILFLFVQDRKMRIEVGYGLEGRLPDSICNRILTEQIAPRLQARDYDGGLTAGVDGLIAAAQGEYKGTGGAANSSNRAVGRSFPWILFLIIIAFAVLGNRCRRGTIYSRGGINPLGGWYIGGGGWGGGGFGGGSGGGGGFSGGGGRFGGGGASGSW
jgi:uncharacterized protein